MQLTPEENELHGIWLDLGSSMIPDAGWERITFLTEEHLELLATGENTTDKLYRDPTDGRLWELTRFAPQMKKGGPPRLTCIDVLQAEKKYRKVIKG